MQGRDQPGNRPWFALPTTAAGQWSVRLAAASVILFVVMQMEVAAGQDGGDTFFANPWLSFTALAAGACVVAAGVVATFAVVVRHERSVLVLLALLLGSLVTIFVAGELFVPH